MGIPNYSSQFEGQYQWIEAGTITVAEPALAVNERDNASVEALADTKKVIIRPDDGTKALELRFRFDASSAIFQIYAARGEDYYTRVCTATIGPSNQICSVGIFGDTITLSNQEWHGLVAEQSVSDFIGRIRLETLGYDRFLIIASTLTATTAYIDYARKDQGWAQ